MSGKSTCILHDIGMDGDINVHHLVMAVGPPGMPVIRVDHRCTISEVPKIVYGDLDNFKGLLGEVNVPLVASGHLAHVKCMIVGCCIGGWYRQVCIKEIL